MLRMDDFSVVVAKSYAEAASAWSPEAMYVAGGTDLLPNLKHRLFHPKTLIHIGGIPGEVVEEEGAIRLGAGVRLSQLATHPVVLQKLAPLATAAGLVAGPQIRNMGTLGGNIMLDTRCLYYNQTEFWRKSLGYCLKAEGTWCHVVGGPKTCVATQSSDTVPVLLCLDAELLLVGPAGERSLKLRDLYRYNGMDHLTIAKGELLTAVRVPLPGPGFRGCYHKLRTRASIDYPQLSVAFTGCFEGDVPLSLEGVIGAVNPQPKPLKGLEAYLGRPLDGAAIEAIAAQVYKSTRPQGSVHGDTNWRRQMAVVYTRRALQALAAAQ